jgi:hypothetical protein
MNYVSEVKAAYAAEFSFGFDSKLIVGAAGVVNSSGWSNIRLSPRFYLVPPGDGVWDFDFIGDPPSGIVLPVELPVSAWCTYTSPPWLKGVKVHAERNSILIQNLKGTVQRPTVRSLGEGEGETRTRARRRGRAT